MIDQTGQGGREGRAGLGGAMAFIVGIYTTATYT